MQAGGFVANTRPGGGNYTAPRADAPQPPLNPPQQQQQLQQVEQYGMSACHIIHHVLNPRSLS
jgi:hypothetical protein